MPSRVRKIEDRIHYVKCTAGLLQKGHVTQRTSLHKFHKKLKIAGVIYDSFLRITSFLRSEGDPPVCISKFDSPMYKMVMEAWDEQQFIGWDKILKFRISSKWGRAYGMIYGNNPHTRHEKNFTSEVWVSKTIRGFLRFSLGL